MYLPSQFEESRPELLHELVRQHPLGLLITLADSGLQANPIPFLLDPGINGSPDVLRGHVARANPLWREARSDVSALVVFQGAQSYVSPSYYPSKAEHGKVVPTWNYVTVQARGSLRVIDDPAWVHGLVTRLTERHETSQAAPWAVSDAPDDFIATILGAIVGIEITLTTLTGKWKVSQNRSAPDRDGVVKGLREQAACNGDSSAAAMAQWVEKLIPPRQV